MLGCTEYQHGTEPILYQTGGRSLRVPVLVPQILTTYMDKVIKGYRGAQRFFFEILVPKTLGS